VTGDRSPRPGDRRRAARRPAARRGPCSLALLAIVLRTTGRRARQVWLGCKRCALSGTDHRDPRTEEGCPVTETRTGLPAAVSSGYPDKTAGGYFVRVAGQDCRRLFRPGSRTRLPPAISFGLHHDGSTTCAITSKRRTRQTSAEPWRGATLPRFQAARSSEENHSVAKGRRDRLSQRPLSSPPQLWRSAVRVSLIRHPR
jgi:hypothetical protein